MAANGAVATTSVLFILEAVILGMLLKYGKLNKWANTAVAILMLVAAVALGLKFPMYLGLNTWHVIIFAYILIACVAPVWSLLQPRDYLNSYLLIFMIVGSCRRRIRGKSVLQSGGIYELQCGRTVPVSDPVRDDCVRSGVWISFSGVVGNSFQTD